jgi:16S rRNA (adenine1518-N6/adenine1519-N6)-dimethyltransferase
MAPHAGHVVTVEIDRHLAPLAKQEFAAFNNVTLLEMDALRTKNSLHPDLIATLQQQVAAIPGGRLKLVANLPYNVATPILSNLLNIEPWPTRMVATIQRELAERIAASPRTKDYSALSIWMQAQCQVEIVRVMPPAVFWPRPKVESAILDIRPQKILRDRIADRTYFHELVRAIFLHRRKFLRSALASAVKDRMDKTAVDEIMAIMNLDATTRAEQLSPMQLIELTELVQDKEKNGIPDTHGEGSGLQ